MDVPLDPLPASPADREPVRAKRHNNRLAVASLVLGLIGLLCFVVPALIALVLGIVARKQIREGKGVGDGFAQVGIILALLHFAILIMLYGWSYLSPAGA